MTGQQPMGFSGLASLASAMPAMPQFDPPPIPSAPPAPMPVRRPPPAPPDEKPFWTKGRAWAAIVIVGLVIWGINAANEGSRSTPAYAPPEQRASRTPSYSAPSIPQTPTYSAPPKPQFSAAPTETETKPAVGRDLTLSRSELRYCFAEKVRVSLMLDLIDDRKSVEVRNVNAYVDDYNARCSSFRYRTSDRAVAQASVDADNASLTAQARARVAAWR